MATNREDTSSDGSYRDFLICHECGLTEAACPCEAGSYQTLPSGYGRLNDDPGLICNICGLYERNCGCE